jgi:hypothetical protein
VWNSFKHSLKHSLSLFLTFATIGYLAAFHPSWYHTSSWLCNDLWRWLVSSTQTIAGKDSWPSSILALIDVGVKGEFGLRIMLISMAYDLFLRRWRRRDKDKRRLASP